MRYTENINLPIVEDNDLYSKEINNLAFIEIDKNIKGINEKIEILDNVEGSILETKEEVESLKNQFQDFKSLNINIADYQIDNTGKTDVTANLQKIFNTVRDNGGGTITFPTGEYYVRNYVDVYSNTHIIFQDGCVITKKGGLGSQTTFAINRIADGQEYGYTAENITFEGGTFDGCKLGLGIVVQKVRNLTFKNMKFIDCMIDSHILDLQGVNNCLVENCVFEGRYPSNSQRIYAECIQYDISSEVGAPSFSGADGTKSYGITIKNCVFKPNVNDVSSCGFTAFGTHSSWNCYHEAIIFENNTIIDSEYVMLSFPSVSNIQIKGNSFINRKRNNIGAIQLNTPDKVYDIETAHLPSTSLTTDNIKYPPKSITISNNLFEGFAFNSTTNPIVSIKGLNNYYVNDLNITNNIFNDCIDKEDTSSNGQDCISLLYCNNANITNNIFNNVRRMVYANTCSNVNIINNTANEIKANSISISKTDYLTISNNTIKGSIQSAIYLINCNFLNINSNSLFNNGLDGTNSIVSLGSCSDSFINNNFIINTNTTASYGINIFKTSVAPSYEPNNNFTSNNVYKGVTHTENFSKDVIGDKSKSGIMINGYQLLTTSKTDKSISVTNISL